MITEVRPFRLALRRTLTTAAGSHQSRAGVLLAVGDGTHTGWGEATPMPGWSIDDLDRTAAAVVRAAADLEGIGDPDGLAAQAVLNDLVGIPQARSAVAGALSDLRARRAGVSLATFLAAAPAGDRPVRTSVAVNALAHGVGVDDVAEECARAVAAGFDAVKLKVGIGPTAGGPGTEASGLRTGSVAEDVARVAAAREVLGPGRSLRLDANGAWSEDEATERLVAVADHDIAWCEEPTTGIDAIARVGIRSSVPVAVDESARTVADVDLALAAGSIGVVVVKPQAIGGPDLALAAIGRVREAGGVAVITSFIDTAIGVAHALHVAAAAGSDQAHGLATSPLLADDVTDPVPVVDGRMRVPSGPGLGIAPA